MVGVLKRGFDISSGLLVTSIATTISIYIARLYVDHRSFLSLGIRWDRNAFYDLVIGFFIAGIIIGLIFVLDWSFGWLTIISFKSEQEKFYKLLMEILFCLLIFFMVGWQEELMFRGYIFQNIQDGMKHTWGLILSSIIFAAYHLTNPNFSWFALLGLIIAGFFLAYPYLRTKMLWLSIGLHFGWNFFEGYVFGFSISGLDTFPSFIEQSVSGPSWITGGAFGPEAGIVLVPAIIVGWILVYLYSKVRARFVIPESQNSMNL